MITLKRAYIVMGAVLAGMLLTGCTEATLDFRGPIRPCAVHDQVLREGKVPIVYGMYNPDPDYHRVLGRLFPNTNSNIHRGRAARSEKRAKIRYCTDCRKAEKDWLKAVPGRKATR